MIQVGLCDDELSVLNQLQILLDRYRVERNQDMVYGAFQSPVELLAQIERGMRFDILFMDVLMPGLNGIEAAREIRKHDANVKIIFLTSSAEFAVESYGVGAFFYQLKPIWEESFFRLMDSVTEECEKQQHKSLILRCKTGITRLELDRLAYCEVIGRTLIFHGEGGKTLESVGGLDKLSAQLAEYENFLRPHRSFLVNMDYIQSISTRSIVMEDGAEIPIPHGKFSEVKQRYLDYAFHSSQTLLS